MPVSCGQGSGLGQEEGRRKRERERERERGGGGEGVKETGKAGSDWGEAEISVRCVGEWME